MSSPTLGFAGAGWITPVHVLAGRALGLKPVAWSSRTRATAEAKAREFGGEVVPYSDLPAGADVVIVATPPSRHAEDTVRALTAGACVVVEKPLCATLADADRIVAAAAAHGERVGYAENLSYSPVVLALLERLPALGQVHHVEARAITPLPTWGSFTTDEWGGGALFDLGAHPLAMALLLAGSDTSVATVRCRLRGGAGHGTDEYGEVDLTFANGGTGHVVASWQGTGPPVWDVQASSRTGVLRAEIMPAPSLEHNGSTVPLPPITNPVPPVEQFGYLGQLRAFLDDFATGRTPFMDATFGRTVLDVTCACYASASAGGEPVAVPYVGNRDRTPLQLWRGDAA